MGWEGCGEGVGHALKWWGVGGTDHILTPKRILYLLYIYVKIYNFITFNFIILYTNGSIQYSI